MLKIKRVYEKAEAADGYRILVDRVWPRGLTKRQVQVQEWAAALAPTTALRRFFGHDPKRWKVFQARYRRELKTNPEATEKLRELRARMHRQRVTLVYSARDEKHNQAVVLNKILRGEKI